MFVNFKLKVKPELELEFKFATEPGLPSRRRTALPVNPRALLELKRVLLLRIL